VRSFGKLMYEMVLGVAHDLKEYAELMRGFRPMAHVGRGISGSFTWQIARAGEFRYGCLIAGNFEAGTVGSIRAAAR